MNILLTAGIALIGTFLSVMGIYNYLPLDILQFKVPEKTLGSSITTIAGTDTLSSSRSVINTNFTNLNTGKFELSDWYATTSAPHLTSLGTITTGVWSGTTIATTKGGTGSTTLSTNQVLLGNGAGNIGVVSGWGTSGQFLTSGGSGAAPSWTTGSVDTGIAYTWTGGHLWTASTTHSATTSISANSVTNNALILNGVATQWPSANGAGASVLSNNGSGVLTWNNPAHYSNTNGSVSVPAGVLNASSTISFNIQAYQDTSGTCVIGIQNGSGTSLASTTIPNAGGGSQTRMDGDARGVILMSNASATIQKSATFGIYINNYTNAGSPGGTLSTSQTSAVDFTSAQTLSAYSSDCVSLYNYSIIVNP